MNFVFQQAASQPDAARVSAFAAILPVHGVYSVRVASKGLTDLLDSSPIQVHPTGFEAKRGMTWVQSVSL